jgi:hypothetical protein
MSIRTLIIAASGVAVLAAGAANAQPVTSKPVPNPPAHKTVIVKHRHGHKIVKVVRHHHGKTVVTKKVVK